MAENIIRANYSNVRGGGGTVVTWSGLGDGDLGEPVPLMQYTDCSFQVEGAFGIHGRCYIEGSNDGKQFRELNNAAGNPLVLSTPGIVRPLERTLLVRPRVVSKDKTALTVIAVFVS